jgi:hypothetical protein
VIVVEHLSNDLIKITADGQVEPLWGTSGSAEGELNDPHGMTIDSSGVSMA